jgi:hypothetical protein
MSRLAAGMAVFTGDCGASASGWPLFDLAQSPPNRGLHARGLITAVDNSHVRQNLIVKTEAQFLTVRLLDGPHRARRCAITNMLTGKMEFDEFYETGRSYWWNTMRPTANRPRRGPRPLPAAACSWC